MASTTLRPSRMAKEAVKKFNEDSTTATAEASASKPKKAMPKKPAHKPSASTSMPSRPSSSAMPSQPISSKPSWPIPHAAPAPPKSLVAPAKSSTPIHLATCQRTAGISIDFGAAEELAETPEAIVMPAFLWHVARCTGAEDFVRAAEDFGGGVEDFGGAGAA